MKGGGPPICGFVSYNKISTHETRKGQRCLQVLCVRVGEVYREILNHRILQQIYNPLLSAGWALVKAAWETMLGQIMLGSSPPQKQPGDLLTQTGRENIDTVVWMERWGQRDHSLLFCYSTTEFPVWLGRLPWSLLCWNPCSDTDSYHPAVIDSDKTWPVSGSVFFLSLLSSSVIYFLSAAHDIFTLCPALLSHSEFTLSKDVRVRSMTAICCRISNIAVCWQHATFFFFCEIKAYNFVFHSDRSFYLHGKKTQGGWQYTVIKLNDERQKEKSDCFCEIQIHKGLEDRQNKSWWQAKTQLNWTETKWKNIIKRKKLLYKDIKVQPWQWRKLQHLSLSPQSSPGVESSGCSGFPCQVPAN